MDVVVREVKVKKQQKAKSSSQQRRRRPPPPPPPPPLPPPRRPRRPPPRPPPPPRQRQLQSNHQLLLPINSKALLLLLCNGFVQVIRKYLYFSSEQSLLRLSNSFLLPSIHYCRTVSSKQILTRNCSATTCSDDEQHYFEAITSAPAQFAPPQSGQLLPANDHEHSPQPPSTQEIKVFAQHFLCPSTQCCGLRCEFEVLTKCIEGNARF